MTAHQFVEGESFKIHTEKLYHDRVIRFIYSEVREHAPSLFRLLTSRRASSLTAFLTYDHFLSRKIAGARTFLRSHGVDFRECLDPIERLDTPKKLFERKIRYWECRPMPDGRDWIVSPADSRVLLGSLSEDSALFLKGKFFDRHDLLDKQEWIDAFDGASYAIFRLTPEQYHYNHAPVAGKVVDLYEIGGAYHSCNPSAIVTVMTPYSKNKRVVTIMDTDVPGGTGVGLVAMVEVVALMIGKITQRYSEKAYCDPLAITKGMFLKKGCPKSLYEPGSSTDVLLFQRGRVEFDPALVNNMASPCASSRFTAAFGKDLVETQIKVRSLIGWALKPSTQAIVTEGILHG